MLRDGVGVVGLRVIACRLAAATHAELVEWLQAQDVRATVFDIWFSEPDVLRPDFDAYFAEVMGEKAGNRKRETLIAEITEKLNAD